MFSLAALDELPSIETRVRPTVNGIYIFFILFPVILAAMGAIVTYLMRQRKLAIADSFWHALILGNEIDDHLLPAPRKSMQDPFPDEDEELHVGMVGCPGNKKELIVLKKGMFQSYVPDKKGAPQNDFKPEPEVIHCNPAPTPPAQYSYPHYTHTAVYVPTPSPTSPSSFQGQGHHGTSTEIEPKKSKKSKKKKHGTQTSKTSRQDASNSQTAEESTSHPAVGEWKVHEVPMPYSAQKPVSYFDC